MTIQDHQAPPASTNGIPDEDELPTEIDEPLHVVEMPGPPDEDPIRRSIIIDDWGRSAEEPHRETDVPGAGL